MEQQEQNELVGLPQLLEAGVHFGHQTRRWNPKMRKYIFTERNGIHIIDLRKTLDRLRAAEKVARKTVLAGNRVIFVCTKPQLRPIVVEEAERCGAFHVTERWLGGMLTNFQTIRTQIRRLKELERGQEEGSFEFYTKKEQLLLERERAKLSKYFSGVKDMGRLPGAIFVVDARREHIAVKEANRLGIPVIAIADTNADPDRIDFPIPGNDDAIRSVNLITGAIADAILSARREVPEEQRRRAEDAEATTYSTETGEKTAAAEDVARRRLRRRRKPRPEVIAKLQKGEGAGGEEGEAQAGAPDTAPKAPPADAAKADSGEAGADAPEAPSPEKDSAPKQESSEAGKD
ncbi:MAG: 30S ribosomal protein S2 [Gemmatimonadales bacterium]|nr:MAG: 30S ribosomal protein S2 [Gemmatimonadales bacterium]